MSEAVPARQPRPRRRAVLLFQGLLILGFLGILAYAFQSNILVPPAGIPDRVEEFELVSQVEGEAALAQVSRLHGTRIPLKDAYIASYAHSGSQLTAWVGRAESEAAALQLIRRMSEGIRHGGGQFSNLRRESVSGKEVFQVDGPEGRRYFYTRDEKVIWLTLQGTAHPNLLPQAVNIFQ